MSTRALTRILDAKGQDLVCIHTEFEGLPEVYGLALAKFILAFDLVESYGARMPNTAKGMGCLAAQIVKQFKTGVGEVYLLSREECDQAQDFDYELSRNHVRVRDHKGRLLFAGTWQEFETYCEQCTQKSVQALKID